MKAQIKFFLMLLIVGFTSCSCNKEPKPVNGGELSVVLTYAAATNTLTGVITVPAGTGINKASFGICVSKNPYPTIADPKGETGLVDASDASNHPVNVSGLDNNASYYVRIYFVSNNTVTYASTNGQFSTVAQAIVNLKDSTAITMTSANIYAEVNPNNLPTDVTVAYGTTQSTLDNVVTVGNYNGKIAISVTGKLPNLTDNKKYYYQVKAKNTAGEVTSTINSFTTAAGIDQDGHYFNAVAIGAQIWMNVNLSVVHYNDNTLIPNLVEDATWTGTTSGAWCDYNNDPANGKIYGKLYNWYAINTGKLAPKGWHVATDADWLTFMTFVGGSNFGCDLKLNNTPFWQAPNTGATNKYGFAAIGGGDREKNGLFIDLNQYGVFWTATAWDSQNGLVNYMTYKSPDIYSAISPKSYGYSVRIVKD